MSEGSLIKVGIMIHLFSCLAVEYKIMEEFQEIALGGGKIEFKKESSGGVSLAYSKKNPNFISLFQVCVSLDGIILDVVPFGGLGSIRPYPQPSLLVFVLSDRNGMVGRSCPECQLYFRVNNIRQGQQICPYCAHSCNSIKFITENQMKYISAFFNYFLDAHESDHDTVIDLDKIITKLPENRPQWLYSEETQQNRYECEDCKLKYDILGEYGICHSCGKINACHVFQLKIDYFEKQFCDINGKFSDRHEREVEWEKLARCVSDFESMANKIRSYMLKIPATPKRKNALKSLSFQNIKKANNCMHKWFGFEILDGITEPDRGFLNKMFNRRHLFIHNAGCVDQEYLDNTGDKLRLNEKVRVKSNHIKRLIPLIRTCGMKLINGYISIE